MRKTYLALMIFSLSFSLVFSVYASGWIIKEPYESATTSRVYQSYEEAVVITNKEELDDVCIRLFGKYRGPKKSDKIETDINLNEQLFIVIIGKQSLEGYSIQHLHQEMTLEEGILKLYFKVTKPKRASSQTRRTEDLKERNPFYMYVSDSSKLSISNLRMIEFWVKGDPRAFGRWSK